jgi:hypothetical protein
MFLTLVPSSLVNGWSIDGEFYDFSE